MKTHIRFISLIIAFIFIIALMPLTASADEQDTSAVEPIETSEPVTTAFSDVEPGIWYFDSVAVLTSQGIIDGFPDGTFEPNGNLTSAQFIKMVCAAVIPAWLDGINSEGYINWAEAYYYAALDNDLIRDGEFDLEKLNDPISRYDASLLLSRALDLNPDDSLQVSSGIAAMIADNSDIPARYLRGVQLGYSEGLLTGYADKKFNGDNLLTRAEGATLIHRLIDEGKRVSLTGQVLENPNVIDDNVSLLSADPETPTVLDPTPQVANGNIAFIGNSLIHGLYLYGKYDKPDYYFSTGISIFSALSSAFSTSYGTSATLADSLPDKEYTKIYLLFGINELDANTKRFSNTYSEVIAQLKQYCPDSEICIISVLPVSKGRNDTSTVFTKDNVNGFNDALKELCAEFGCTYVDVYSLIADSDGYLPESSTWDGIHLNNGIYVTWADFLKS